MVNDQLGKLLKLSEDGSILVAANDEPSKATGFNSSVVWAWQRPFGSSLDMDWDTLCESSLDPKMAMFWLSRHPAMPQAWSLLTSLTAAQVRGVSLAGHPIISTGSSVWYQELASRKTELSW